MKCSDMGIPTRIAFALALVVFSPTFALFAIAMCWLAALLVLTGSGEVDFGPGAAGSDDEERGDG